MRRCVQLIGLLLSLGALTPACKSGDEPDTKDKQIASDGRQGGDEDPTVDMPMPMSLFKDELLADLRTNFTQIGETSGVGAGNPVSFTPLEVMSKPANYVEETLKAPARQAVTASRLLRDLESLLSHAKTVFPADTLKARGPEGQRIGKEAKQLAASDAMLGRYAWAERVIDETNAASPYVLNLYGEPSKDDGMAPLLAIYSTDASGTLTIQYALQDANIFAVVSSSTSELHVLYDNGAQPGTTERVTFSTKSDGGSKPAFDVAARVIWTPRSTTDAKLPAPLALSENQIFALSSEAARPNWTQALAYVPSAAVANAVASPEEMFKKYDVGKKFGSYVGLLMADAGENPACSSTGATIKSTTASVAGAGSVPARVAALPDNLCGYDASLLADALLDACAISGVNFSQNVLIENAPLTLNVCAAIGNLYGHLRNNQFVMSDAAGTRFVLPTPVNAAPTAPSNAHKDQLVRLIATDIYAPLTKEAKDIPLIGTQTISEAQLKAEE